MLNETAPSPMRDEMRAVYDSFVQQVPVEDVLKRYEHFVRSVPVTLCTDGEFMRQAEALAGDVIFEGAHASLLDREYGYFPYVAKTDTTTNEAIHILEQTDFHGSTVILGVVRALGYRHGPGPFVTEEKHLSGLFGERHNKPNEWQGAMRYGWFDLPAIRHGVRLNRGVDALALTMLDHLLQVGSFRVCLSYEYRGADRQHLEQYFEFATTRMGRIKITAIKPVPTQRTDTLARLLFDCVPWDWVHFEAHAEALDAFLRFLESPDGLGIPVAIISSGATISQKQERNPQQALLWGI
jgi:adenylosuccinate synthase